MRSYNARERERMRKLTSHRALDFEGGTAPAYGGGYRVGVGRAAVLALYRPFSVKRRQLESIASGLRDWTRSWNLGVSPGPPVTVFTSLAVGEHLAPIKSP